MGRKTKVITTSIPEEIHKWAKEKNVKISHLIVAGYLVFNVDKELSKIHEKLEEIRELLKKGK